MAENESEKSPEKSQLFQPGGPQGPGRGPEKGAPNAGRPRDEYLNWCAEVLTDPEVEDAVKAVLRDPKNRGMVKLYTEMWNRVRGKPVQPLSGPDGSPLIPAGINVKLVKSDDGQS